MSPLYGIWLKRLGWLKGTAGKCVSFELKEVAADTARRFGGQVRYIDDSLRDLEAQILQQEELEPPTWWGRLLGKGRKG